MSVHFRRILVPLDGSRLLYAVAPLGLRDVMDKIEKAGLGAIFVFLFILGPFVLPYLNQVTGWFVQILIPGLTAL